MRGLAQTPGRALRRFGFKQTLRGAIILGLVSGFILVVQGVAYEKSYTTAAARAQFAATLTSAPALGLLYGDAKNLAAGTNGYIVYRVVGFMSFIAATWALLATTRLLRGSEEDGRWKVMRTGTVTARAVTWHVLAGFVRAWAVALIISLLVTVGIAAASGLHLPFVAALAITLMIFLPGLLFGALGALTSQLALTRQRAVLYGLVPLLGLFLLRGAANTSAALHPLLAWTPFGWSELVNPILDPQYWWLLPSVALACVCAALGIRLAQRDLGSSIIRQSDTTRPRYFLLGSGWQLGLRQNLGMFAVWTTAALFVAGLIAALSTLAINATAGSASLSKSLNALAGNSNDIKVAFLGAGLIFVVMILLIMATSVIGTIRADEAKQYLDNILVQPRRRTTWLAGRLLLGFGITLFVALTAGAVTYVVASRQDIVLNFATVMTASICLAGSGGFLIGLGALIYGLVPRVAAASMYLVIGWSFLIILLSSVMHLGTAVVRSSLFHYTSFNLAAAPQWGTFGALLALGLAMAAAGVIAFSQRDIVTE